jgi:hypothetical protein
MFFPGQAYHLAKNHISILVPRQMGRYLLDPGGFEQEIIGVEKKEPIALRLSQSQVKGMSDAAIRSAMPISQAGFIPANDVHRTIRGATVDNDIFHLWVALR